MMVIAEPDRTTFSPTRLQPAAELAIVEQTARVAEAAGRPDAGRDLQDVDTAGDWDMLSVEAGR
jgi:hypothetical protein